MKVKKRGFDSLDRKWFMGEDLKTLKKSADEIQFLLDRDYKMNSAVEFVGNHYLLSKRQRNALKRSLASNAQYKDRRSKVLPCSRIKDNYIYVDGFNLIITLEVALSNSLLILGRDGAIRDLAGLRGTYKIIDKTYIALEILGDFFKKEGIGNIQFYLDAPVSNSGNLKLLMLKILGNKDLNVEVELVKNPDKILMDKDRIVSSDALILDNCKSWFNISKEIITEYIDDPFLIDFN